MTIIDLPNEPKFTIKDVASRTGIRPVTLRAWERRHEVLNPYRSENHYRLYSERDIAILRWLKYRVDEGQSISSAISELRSLTSNSIWPEAIPLIPKPVRSPGDTPPAVYAQRLYHALIRHNETLAGNLLREVHARFDLHAAFHEVIGPAIRHIDHARYRSEIEPAVARFASSYLRGKLLTLLQAYPSRHNAPLVLVGCAPMETRELEVLMLAVLLRSQGYRVEYLGPDIPVDDLVHYAADVHPALVILSANSEFTARETRRLQEKLRKVRGAPVYGYTGRVFEQRPALRKEIPGMYLGGALDGSLTTIKSLLSQREKNGRK